MFTVLSQNFPTPQVSAWFDAFLILSLTSCLQNAWHEIFGQRPKASDTPALVLRPYVAIYRLIGLSVKAWFKLRSFSHGGSRHRKTKHGGASWARTPRGSGTRPGALPLPPPPLEGTRDPLSRAKNGNRLRLPGSPGCVLAPREQGSGWERVTERAGGLHAGLGREVAVGVRLRLPKKL